MKKLFLLFCTSIATVPSFCSSTNIDQAFESSSLQEQMQPDEQLLSQNQEKSFLQGKARLFIAPLVAGIIQLIISLVGVNVNVGTVKLICLVCYFLLPITGILTYFLFCYKVKAGFGVKFFRSACISFLSILSVISGFFCILFICGMTKDMEFMNAVGWTATAWYGALNPLVAFIINMIFVPICTHYLFRVSYPTKPIDSASEENNESLTLKEAA